MEIYTATPITSVVPEGSLLNFQPLLYRNSCLTSHIVLYKTACLPSTQEVCVRMGEDEEFEASLGDM